ncbi:MAG: apolipoprotein and lipocalin family protein [Chthoniobacter sp.]|jgi:apolipoprotein D and lipocalin family protein|nr:apolipoprotein and lipocalin family protein [Chthoniobacter sp.]
MVILIFSVTLGLCACSSTTKAKPLKKSSAPLRTVQFVDLPRYMGDWRVIASIPSSAEKGCVDAVESYALRPDGKIETWFTYRKKSFDAPQKTVKAQATVVNKETNAEWRVKSFGFGSVPHLVIDLDPNYQWTVMGHPSRDYGWILARERTMPNTTYELILDRLAAHGFDPARFARVQQLPGGFSGAH